ncbi:MAG TPA: hypothetical protein VMF31_05055 [Solirubrobacterales bacterium]|nr:hypothetical protein [Solirubrobacterales bacterium]
MDIKNTFLFFGIGLAVIAVVVSFVGLRSKNFPSRGAMIGLILLGVVFVVGTAVFGVKLQIEEAEEREHGDKHIIGEEASVSPIVIPANLT